MRCIPRPGCGAPVLFYVRPTAASVVSIIRAAVLAQMDDAAQRMAVVAAFFVVELRALIERNRIHLPSRIIRNRPRRHLRFSLSITINSLAGGPPRRARTHAWSPHYGGTALGASDREETKHAQTCQQAWVVDGVALMSPAADGWVARRP